MNQTRADTTWKAYFMCVYIYDKYIYIYIKPPIYIYMCVYIYIHHSACIMTALGAPSKRSGPNCHVICEPKWEAGSGKCSGHACTMLHMPTCSPFLSCFAGHADAFQLELSQANCRNG